MEATDPLIGVKVILPENPLPEVFEISNPAGEAMVISAVNNEADTENCCSEDTLPGQELNATRVPVVMILPCSQAPIVGVDDRVLPV